ncbi:MAG TPA: oxygenase MpaB family protein [Polyangiales bacterium]|nr:oxygenase MpaB family protein [Polyangiales bacterium]
MSYPRRLSGMAAARVRYGVRADRIAEFFSEGDALADAAVTALRELPGGQARQLLERALQHGIDAVEAPPPALVALFRQLEHVPFWVDHERCTHGGEVFYRCGPFGGMALGFGALARAYCSSGGNKPLTLTGALIDRTPARIANTGNFMCAVSARDGLLLRAPGFCAAVQVRLMHARIRTGLLAKSSWRSDDWGVPINQADTALTALLFSHGFAGFVRKLGVHVSAEEEADLVHLWRYAGYLMGVREELLCATVAEAQQLAEIVDMIDAGPDDDSRRLLEPLLERRPSELAVRSERVGRFVQRLFTAACRDMIGDAFADRVGLPFGPGDLGFRYVFRPTISLLNRAQRRIPGAAERGMRAGERYWAAVGVDAGVTEPVKGWGPDGSAGGAGERRRSPGNNL